MKKIDTVPLPYWCLFAGVLLVYGLLNLFNHPSADDFSYASKVLDLGFWQTQIDMYREWSGRYFSTALMSFNPVAWQALDAYPLWSALNFILFLASSYAFFAVLPGRLNLNISPLILWSGFVLIFLSGLPSPSQGLYWMAGYVNYVIPLSLLFFAGRLYWDSFDSAPFFRLWRVALLCILIAAMGGSNETLLFQISVFLFVSSLVMLTQRRRDFVWHCPLVLTAAVSAMVVALAPGNRVRARGLDDVNPFESVFNALVTSPIEHFFQFLSLPLLVAVLGTFYWSITRPTDTNLYLPTIPMKLWWGILWLWLAVGFLPAQIAMGGNPARRVDNMFYGVFVVLLVMIALQYAQYQRPKVTKLLARLRCRKASTLWLLFGVAVVVSPNNLIAVYDLFARSPQYDAYMDRRYERIIQAESRESIEVPAFDGEHPETVFFNDVKADSNHWINVAYAKYFDLEAISVEKP